MVCSFIIKIFTSNSEVRLKTGRFSAGEDDQLRKNWEEYCDVSGVDADEVQFYMGCDQRKKKGSRYFRPWMCRFFGFTISNSN